MVRLEEWGVAKDVVVRREERVVKGVGEEVVTEGEEVMVVRAEEEGEGEAETETAEVEEGEDMVKWEATEASVETCATRRSRVTRGMRGGSKHARTQETAESKGGLEEDLEVETEECSEDSSAGVAEEDQGVWVGLGSLGGEEVVVLEEVDSALEEVVVVGRDPEEEGVETEVEIAGGSLDLGRQGVPWVEAEAEERVEGMVVVDSEVVV